MHTSIRRMATNGGGNGKTPFLSDILARIEKINLNKELLGKPKAVPPRRKPAEKNTSQGNRQQNSMKQERIKVADHPLFAGRLDRQKIERESTGRFPRRRYERSDQGLETPVKIEEHKTHPFASEAPGSDRFDRTRRAPRTTRPQMGQSERPPRTNTGRPQRERPARTQDKGSKEVKTLISRDVTAKEYKPSLKNHFLYGKSTNVQFNPTSRITSLIKTQLLDSKYPFKLPRSIIENAPAETDNKFLLSSSSYSLDIDEKKLNLDVNRIVRGKPDNVQGKSLDVQLVNKNSTLSLDKRTAIVNLVKNKNLKDVFKDAHWKL